MDEGRVYDLLERIANLLRNEERRFAQRTELQPVHIHTLSYIRRANRYSDTPGAVTEYLGVTKGTASQSVILLKNRGLVVSWTDPDDARKAHLRLTRKGKRLLEEAIPPVLLRRALSSMREEDGSLESRLGDLLRSLQQVNQSRTFGVCHTCRHFQQTAGQSRCGLTQEPLKLEEIQQICREHENPR